MTRLRVLIVFVLLVAGDTNLWAAEAVKQDDLIDLGSTMPLWERAVVYGSALAILLVLALRIPDFPLLAYVFTMPIVLFSGLGVGLACLQCGIVCLKAPSPLSLLPSWLLSLFLFTIAASAAWALDFHDSLFTPSIGVLAMLKQVPLLLAAGALLHSGLGSARRLLWALTLGCIPGCLLTIRNALAGVRFLSEGKEYYMGFIAPDKFSPMLVMAGAFLVFCLLSPSVRKAARLFALGALPLVGIGLLLSGIRSGWIALLIIAGIALARTRNLAAIAGGAVALLLLGFAGFYAARDLQLADKISSRMSDQSMSTGQMRLSYWKVAARGFSQHPLVGTGWGTFPTLAAQSEAGRQAVTHNIFMRVACELGSAGLILFLAWIAVTFRALWRPAVEPFVALALVGVLIQGIFLDHFVGDYFWLAIGMCDGLARCRPAFRQATELHGGVLPRLQPRI